MAKPVPRRIPSDDCTVTIEGEEFAPHEGEWVELFIGASVQQLRLTRRLAEMLPKIEALEGEDGGAVAQLGLMGDSIDEAVKFLSDRIVSWTWTDHRGRELPTPADDASVLERITIEEVMYLISAAQGETPGEQKNDLRSSQTSSSDTAPQPIQE